MCPVFGVRPRFPFFFVAAVLFVFLGVPTLLVLEQKTGEGRKREILFYSSRWTETWKVGRVGQGIGASGLPITPTALLDRFCCVLFVCLLLSVFLSSSNGCLFVLRESKCCLSLCFSHCSVLKWFCHLRTNVEKLCAITPWSQPLSY